MVRLYGKQSIRTESHRLNKNSAEAAYRHQVKQNDTQRNHFSVGKIGKRGQNIMPVYIINNPKNGGIYTRQEMETTYKTSVNKRKFRTFTAWVNALEKSGQLEIA